MVKPAHKAQEIWMPHAGHFICGHLCRFRLNTYVNGYIISTVGEYVPDSRVREIIRSSDGRQTKLIGDAEEADFGFQEIGLNRKYETMTFKAKKSGLRCCPYAIIVKKNLDFAAYNDAASAYKGHLRLVEKFRVNGAISETW